MTDNIGGSEPVHILGISGKKLLVYIPLAVVSLVLLIYVGNLYASLPGHHVSSPVNNFLTGGIYIAFNYAGLLSVLAIVFSISTVFSAMLALFTSVLVLVNGRLLLFEDYAVWKRRGKTQRVEYSEFTDAYLGYQATLTTTGPGSGNASRPTYGFFKVASFYIGNKRFNFNVTKKPGMIKFLKSKIPKENIDVEDDEDAAPA